MILQTHVENINLNASSARFMSAAIFDFKIVFTTALQPVWRINIAMLLNYIKLAMVLIYIFWVCLY